MNAPLPAAAADLPVPVRHPLSFPAYRSFWIARICAMLAQSNFVVALGWAVYDIARSSMDVSAASLRIGLIGLTQFVPALLLNPMAGLAADRFDRRSVVRASLIGQVAVVGLLACATDTRWSGLPLLYGAAAGFAAARAFYLPALNALAPALVPPSVFPRAVALSAIAGRTGGILGPVLGGFAYAISPRLAFVATTALLASSCVAQFTIRVTPHARPLVVGSPLVRIAEGLTYVRRNRLLLGAISLDLFAMLFGGATALLPAYARDVLHVGPAGLGLLRSAMSVGAVLTALWMAWAPIEHQVGRKMLGCVILFGLATIGFGLSHDLWLSLAFLAIAGAADMISIYVRQTLVQVATPDAMRGRVGATSTLFITASNELGEMESGLAAAWLGPVGSVVFGGGAAIAITVLWGWLFPEMRNVARFSDLQQSVLPEAELEEAQLRAE